MTVIHLVDDYWPADNERTFCGWKITIQDWADISRDGTAAAFDAHVKGILSQQIEWRVAGFSIVFIYC